MGFFSKIFGGLKKTKDAITSKLSSIFVGELDDDFYEELEYVLLSSDIGAEATDEIIENVKMSIREVFTSSLRSLRIRAYDIKFWCVYHSFLFSISSKSSVFL